MSTLVEVQAPTLSNRYTAVSTNEVIKALESRGFRYRHRIGGKISPKNGGTTRHVVRMKFSQKIEVGGDILVPEAVITNSFDGKSSFKVHLGLYRQVCTNGLTVQFKDLGEIKLRHSGDADSMAIQILGEMVDRIPQLVSLVEQMRSKVLTEEQAVNMAMMAAKLRWNKAFTPEQAKVLLKAARPEDTGMHLWEIFNRIQENSLSVAGLEIPGMRRTRLITHARNYERVNTGLFTLAAEQMN